MKKTVAILGSTGSIGKNTYNIIKNNKKDFEVILLTTNKNIKAIYKQSKELKAQNILVSRISVISLLAFVKCGSHSINIKLYAW